MKAFLFLTVIFFGFAGFASEQFETTCKQNDCFKFGWITFGDNYVLDTTCKNDDCQTQGWRSVSEGQLSYDVTCKSSNCFANGWNSTQFVGVIRFEDDVTCNFGSCLFAGWKVKTGYDMMGGNVTCHYNDCSKHGGYSSWRGKTSHTTCYGQDCYHKGWTLYID